VIYISIGITALAIGSIIMTHKQTRIELDRAYQKGFQDGAEAILERRYKRLDELENEKD
jgi:hypothetical protein